MNRPTYRQLLNEGEKYLHEAGIEEAGNDAWLLLAHAASMDRTAFFLRGTQEASTEERENYRQLLRARHERIPLQHILGEQAFMGFSFRCDKRALIPRPDTEIAVQEAQGLLEQMKNRKEDFGGRERLRVLDLCCGSGCIGISLSLLVPDLEVVCSDLSREALSLADENAAALGADVKLVRSDMFGQIDGRFALIISNPPYIPAREIGTLQPEVALHDPFMALDGGADGLDFYRIIAEESPGHLQSGGWLVLEIGCSQAEAVQGLLVKAGFEQIRIRQDLGGLNRVICGRLPEAFQDSEKADGE